MINDAPLKVDVYRAVENVIGRPSVAERDLKRLDSIAAIRLKNRLLRTARCASALAA